MTQRKLLDEYGSEDSLFNTFVRCFNRLVIADDIGHDVFDFLALDPVVDVMDLISRVEAVRNDTKTIIEKKFFERFHHAKDMANDIVNQCNIMRGHLIGLSKDRSTASFKKHCGELMKSCLALSRLARGLHDRAIKMNRERDEG